MSIPAVKNFTNYNKYKNETGYTKQGELQQYLQNQNDVLTATAQALLWQPETSYTVGQLVSSPSMTAGTLARVTTAGKTSDTEPTWTASGTTVTDGTVTWTVTKAVLAADFATSDEAKSGTATDRMISPATLKSVLDTNLSPIKTDISDLQTATDNLNTNVDSLKSEVEEINIPVYYLDSDGCLCEKIFVEVTE